MTDQNNVIQLLPLHFIGDIKNVGSRLTSGFSRWERSPTPVRVGVNTSCPLWLSSLATRRQHHAPRHAPWTRTNVAMLSPHRTTLLDY
jgi:hypothetical protein